MKSDEQKVKEEKVAAIVLAAGRSTRMGRPKMILPWGNTTVVGRVVFALAEGGVEEILVVSGGDREAVEYALEALPVPDGVSLRIVFNPAFAKGEMLSSFQAGLLELGENVRAVLVALGDQPQIEAEVIRTVMEEYHNSHSPLVIPSFRMRRGHPWLVDRSFWQEVLALRPPQTLRDFQQTHADLIHYALVETSTILADLDTPDDYQRVAPES